MTQDERALGLARSVERDLIASNRKEMSMTDATQAIWGTSGRGSPNAVRVIEEIAECGYLKVRRVGRVRYVSRTSKM